MEPSLEDLLVKTEGGKFELAILAARRARQINAYYNQLGEGLGRIMPPQVTSMGKPLTIAFEEIATDKMVPVDAPPETEAEADADAAADAASATEADASGDSTEG